jgi:UDP-N-acetylglucosamine 2-epimerase (non-hydrolysing)
MKIISVIGARPQIIKEAMFQKELSNFENINEIVIHTGQHYDNKMSGDFFDKLNIKKPDYFLNINQKSHAEMTALMMIELEKIFIYEKPDYVLVYGDTNSTLAGAIVARKMNIKVIHVEAGLRQEPKSMPEEINRVLTDHSSDFLFVPSDFAIKNLEREGIDKNVYNVGDIMYDLYKYMEPHFNLDIYKKLGLVLGNYLVLTLHRDFNVDNKEFLEMILISLSELSTKISIVFPIHPRTMNRIKEFSLEKYLHNFVMVEPLDYFDLMGLVKNSYKVITDSGGLQKEAYFSFKQACIIMPDTGWRELIDLKYNILVNNTNLIDKVLQKPTKIDISNIYGDGNTAKRIIEILIGDFNNNNFKGE